MRRRRKIYGHHWAVGMKIAAQGYWEYLKDKKYAVKEGRRWTLLNLGRYLPINVHSVSMSGYRRFRSALQQLHNEDYHFTDRELIRLLQHVPGGNSLEDYVSSLLEK